MCAPFPHAVSRCALWILASGIVAQCARGQEPVTIIPGDSAPLLGDPIWGSDPYGSWQAAAPAPWTWQLLPEELLYRSYLGSPTEPRLSSAFLHESDAGWFWDFTIGARIGLLRLGSPKGAPPEGWQLDVHAAALSRINAEQEYDLEAVDFSAGVPLTWRQGPWQTKIEYRHLSSHVGDEFLIRNPGFPRINYVRDSIVLGAGVFPYPDLRLYAEADYAFATSGIDDPWHFQFGVDYSPRPVVHWIGWNGAPYIGVNGQLREEADFGGGVNVIAGWQIQGVESPRILRVGVQYYNGKSLQYSFFDEHEELVGVGVWYDY